MSPYLPSAAAALAEVQYLLDEDARIKARTQLMRYDPYDEQRAFHAQGLVCRERLLMAANQVGKSMGGAAETAFHLTGRYPDWWQGRRWKRPTRGWAGSKTAEVTRDSVQRMLVGEPKDRTAWGTGLIPGGDLLDWSLRTGGAGAIDWVTVRHVCGGCSTLGFKSYDQGREKWQGETLDFVWFDEEPPLDVYIEGLTRTNAAGGMVWMTFTPLLGMTEVVKMYMKDGGVP